MTQLISIQYLRAIAALMVVIVHMGIPLKRMGWVGVWPERLSSGVNIFFVISGFIMFVMTYGKNVGPAEFYYRRIVRIVPLYWMLTSIIVLIMLISPSAMNGYKFELSHVIASYLFIPAVNPMTGTLLPVLIPGWTLNYEMFFYLMFGAALLLSATRRLVVMLAALGGLAALGVFQPSFYTSSIMVEFGVGIAIGWLFVKGFTLPWWFTSTSVFGGFIFIAIFGSPVAAGQDGSFLRLLLWGVPSAFIVAGALSAEKHGQLRQSRLLHLMGDASYSTYLSHKLCLSLVCRWWISLGLAEPPGGFVLFVIFGAIAASLGGIALYLLVEKPMIPDTSGSGGGRRAPMYTSLI